MARHACFVKPLHDRFLSALKAIQQFLPRRNAPVDNVVWFVNRPVPFWVDVFGVSPAEHAAVIAEICGTHFHASPASDAVERAFVTYVFCPQCFFGVLADFDNAVIAHNTIAFLLKLFLANFFEFIHFRSLTQKIGNVFKVVEILNFNNIMKLLAFTDFHASIAALKKVHGKAQKYKPDLALCCGDITVFEQNIAAVMARLGALPTKLLLIHGNHEEERVVGLLAKRYENILLLHKKTFLYNGVLFVGYGGQGFVKRDREFERFIQSIDKKLRTARCVVLMTHQPPFGTKLDRRYNSYVGNESFSKCIRKHKNILLALSGHIHETFGRKDKLGNALVLNPGPDGVIIEIVCV